MRHAYLITAFNNFRILKKLITLLDDRRNILYLHIDKKVQHFDPREFAPLATRSTLVFAPRMVVNWAGCSHVVCTLELLKQALGSSFDYCHLISGTDLPLKTQDAIDAFFTRHAGREFVDFAPENDALAKFKCDFYHFFVDNRWYRRNLLLKALNHGLVRFQRLLKVKRSRVELKHGSAWFSITPDLARYVLENEKMITRNYRFTIAPDECFLQTLVYHSPFKDRVYRYQERYYGNARFIDWTRRQKSSPYTFRSADFPALVGADEGICFARKFDEAVDFEVVEKLFEHLSRPTPATGSPGPSRNRAGSP